MLLLSLMLLFLLLFYILTSKCDIILPFVVMSVVCQTRDSQAYNRLYISSIFTVVIIIHTPVFVFVLSCLPSTIFFPWGSCRMSARRTIHSTRGNVLFFCNFSVLHSIQISFFSSLLHFTVRQSLRSLVCMMLPDVWRCTDSQIPSYYFYQNSLSLSLQSLHAVALPHASQWRQGRGCMPVALIMIFHYMIRQFFPN